jgi:hypothetical protein
MTYLPEMRAYICDGHGYIDYRTDRLCVPYTHNGRCFDSFQHRWVHEWRLGGGPILDDAIDWCKPWLTKEEYTALRAARDARIEAKQLRLVEQNQPWAEC